MFKNKIRVILAAIAVLFFSGIAAVSTIPAANAAVPVYGICSGSTCIRDDPPSYYQAWNKDISGDSLQQSQRIYEGRVGCSSTTCWPFTNGNGFNAAYSGWYVYEIYNIHDGYCMVAPNANIYVNRGNCGGNGVYWVWDGAPSGHLVNVYQTNRLDSTRMLTSVGSGFVLETGSGGNQLWSFAQGSL